MATRKNPFIGVGQDGVVPGARNIADAAENAEFGTLWRMRHRAEIMDGRTAIDNARGELLRAYEVVNQPGRVATQAEKELFDEAGRQFNLARNQHGFESGKFWPSVKGAVREMLGKLGIDANGIGAGKLRGDVHKTILKTYEAKEAGFIERALSKPFRAAAQRPGIALIVTGIGAVALGGTYLKHRAEKRTEREAQAEMMAAMQSQQAAAQVPSYKNSVSQADMAAMQARMEADGKAAPSHAASVAQAQQQAAPVAAAL